LESDPSRPDRPVMADSKMGYRSSPMSAIRLARRLLSDWMYGVDRLSRLSQNRARSKKITSYTGAVLSGQGFSKASNSASGLEDQLKREAKEGVDQKKAQEALKGERERENNSAKSS
jgi:hypothetical protein